MKHIKHINEFFYFHGDSYKAIVIFMETSIGIGIFTEKEANSLYKKLYTPEMDIQGNAKYMNMNVKMIEIPPNSNIISVGDYGEDITTTSTEEIENLQAGEPIDHIVTIGKDYKFENDVPILFNIDKELDGFTIVDHSGLVRLADINEVLAIFQK